MRECDLMIVTGWSDPGGSTESYINLTNALNRNGVSTVMIGRHPYHKGKCNGGTFEEFQTTKAKNVIWHFLQMSDQAFNHISKCNTILSCHEHALNRVFYKYNTGMFDHFHFVSEKQKQYHLETDTPKDDLNIHVIPNLLDPTLIQHLSGPTNKVGGVIGSIDRNKQTHISIMKALADGCDIVRIFGKDTDQEYYLEYICPLLKDPRVFYHGVIEDKNKMYSSISDVYHYSASETWGYIKAECQYLGIPFHSDDESILELKNEEDIINSWKEILV